jgi:apolipoprotein N-acyltransferase
VVAGLLLGLSAPPWGFWPLALVGLALLYRLTRDLNGRHRFLAGFEAGFVLYSMTLWWMTEFHPGGIVVSLIEGAFFGLAWLLVPRRSAAWRLAALPAALLLADALRTTFPVEGLPLGGVELGLASSPLLHAARLGGRLVLPALAALLAAAILEAATQRRRAGTVAFVVAVAVLGGGWVAPDGEATGTIDVAVVQGGGRRGYRAVDGDPAHVLDAHLAASEMVVGQPDLVMWPEDVVDTDGPIAGQPEGVIMANLARDLDATVVAGVVEGDGPAHFRNAAVAWGPDGEIVDRYEKVRRVPFGEYVPWRATLDRFADLSVIPRDAIKGRGTGLLETAPAELATAISYEVFFPDRVRPGVRAGGEIVLIPTNAASFATSQVPTQQLAAARLRAVEAGRWLLQAGPTGYSAVIDQSGELRDRSVLGRRQVLHAEVPTRTGLTPFARYGPGPWVAGSLLALLVAWVSPRLRRRGRP